MAILVPARNEEAVIGACLESLVQQRCRVPFRIIVIANGCTDRTYEVSESFRHRARAAGHSVVVVHVPAGSKPVALNAGDRFAEGLSRLYLDADVSLSPNTVQAIVDLFEQDPGVKLAAPALRIERSRSYAARAYSEVWSRLPYVAGHVMAVGVYAVAASGRDRWGKFPDLLSDDKYARLHFKASETRILDQCTASVRMPERLWDLVRIRSRWIRGNWELRMRFPELVAGDRCRYAGLARLFLREPSLSVHIPTFVAVFAMAWLRALIVAAGGLPVWERARRASV